MAERERDLRRTGEVRMDELLSLKKPKSLKLKINPSLSRRNYKKNESFLPLR